MRLLRSIWFFYGVTAFFVLVVICFPFYILSFIVFGKRSIRPLIKFSHHVVARIALFLMGIRVRRFGGKFLRTDQVFVYISNHQSSIDILINAVTVPFIFKFLSKKEVGKIPLFGYIANKFSIMVDRKSPESRAASFEAMQQALEDGYSVYFAPEGTRNRTDELLTKFYDGAFRLAIATQTPLLVQTLVNPGQLNNPRHSFDLAPGRVNCYFESPIDTTGLTLDDLENLKEEVKELMLRHLK